MGIHDRDYARPSGGSVGGPPGAMSPTRMVPSWRSFSVTTWIIIINVAIFMIDALLFSSGVAVQTDMGKVMISPVADGTPLQAIADTTQPVPNSPYLGHPIVNTQTGELVGYERFTYMPPIQAIGHFSTGKGFFSLEVWRLLTFQFLHGSLTHLLFNMIGLFFFGALVERYFQSPRRYLAFYLICGIAGAVLYLLLNLLGEGFGLNLPLVLAGDWYTPLIGASAGVFGILMASAYVAGNATMLVMAIIPMKISTGAYLLTAIAAFNLITGGSNAGGDAAHIGGAIAGFYFIRRPHLLNEFFDFFGPKIPIGRSKSLSAHKVRPGKKKRGKAKPANKNEKELDRILAKVSREGLGALSEKERKFLSEQSEE